MNEQKEMIAAAEQRVQQRRVAAGLLRPLMEKHADYRTLGNLIRIIEFDRHCVLVDDRSDMDANDIVIRFSNPPYDIEDEFLLGYDFDIFQNTYIVQAAKVVSNA